MDLLETERSSSLALGEGDGYFMSETAHGARGDAPKLPTRLYSLVEHIDHGRILG